MKEYTRKNDMNPDIMNIYVYENNKLAEDRKCGYRYLLMINQDGRKDSIDFEYNADRVAYLTNDTSRDEELKNWVKNNIPLLKVSGSEDLKLDIASIKKEVVKMDSYLAIRGLELCPLYLRIQDSFENDEEAIVYQKKYKISDKQWDAIRHYGHYACAGFNAHEYLRIATPK